MVLRHDIALIFRITLASAVVGAIYGQSHAIAQGASMWGMAGVPRGAFTGGLIGAILSSFETLALPHPVMAPLARAPFLIHMGARAAIYLVVILFGLAAGAWLFPEPSDPDVTLGVSRDDVVFAFAVSFVFNFVMDINRLLGQNVLLNFAVGRYHQPRLEERVFLFIDMQGSTALAERLGALAFRRLVNRFVIDLTGPIVAARGEIHRYVGDELIATWKLADGTANANCVRACFNALDRLAMLAPDYAREFGTGVSCRAALHCGPVVTGEMGSIKTEIVFLGDTLNTAARIQELCRLTGNRVLASAALVDRLELPPGIAKHSVGDQHLRGKEHEVMLYSLESIADEKDVGALVRATLAPAR